jgi:hypothetical protein
MNIAENICAGLLEGGMPGMARRVWASGDLATTTRGEMKADVIGVQNTGDDEHESREAETWSIIVERIVMNSILK